MSKIAHIDPNEALISSIKDNLEANTLLGREFMRQFRMALANKKSQTIGDSTIHEILVECFEARDNKITCKEREFLDKYPQWAHLPISLVSFKVDILIPLIRKNLMGVAQAPFIIDPTPVPEIPQKEKDRILDELMADVESMSSEIVLAQQQYIAMAMQQGIDANTAAMQQDFPRLDPELIKKLVKEQKVKLFQQVKEHAEQQAQLLQRELYDKTTEGGYRKAISEFIDDFVLYPFACMHGPFPITRSVTKWKKNKFVEEKKVVWAFERISPFDLFWTSDSVNTQDGTAVFIRKKVSHDYLYDCRKLAKDDPDSGYIYDTIDDLIEITKESCIPRHWTEFDGKNPEIGSENLIWSRGEDIEILIRYGRFSGYDLKEIGFEHLDEDELYETKIIMCGGQVIYCAINNNPSQYKRPVFTTSFISRNSSIAGVGLGQKLLPLHRAYRAVLHLAMYNLGLSSEPLTEVEVNRILQYMPDEWIDEPIIAPGMVIPADGDRMGNGSRAVKFTQIPNTTDSALRFASYLLELSHVISNIPAALHGQPVGSGANRTVRGLLTLQGNTLEPINSSLTNLDIEVIEPMVTLLYILLVMYDEDFDYSGDCKVVAGGASSMIQREIDKQAAMENLQILGQLGPQVNPEILNRTVVKLLSLAEIIEPGEEVLIPQMASSTQNAPQQNTQPEQSQPVE